MFKLCDCNGWASSEALLWWFQDRKSPPLMVVAAPGQLPVLGDNNTVRTVFGNSINGGMSPGFRGDYGIWLDAGIGVGTRLTWLSENESTANASNPGPVGISIAAPYIDTSLGGAENGLLGALDPTFSGSIAARSALEVYGAEAYGRLRHCAGSCARIDFIAGYSHYNVDDELTLNVASTIR
ncbi:unnamed protein product, partial [marine sediment metagenome]